MSIHVISLALRKQFGSPLKKLVALKLADCANDDGSRVYPSIGTISAETEICERTVYGILSDFRQRGLVTVIAPGGGRQKSTRYRLNLSAWQELPAAAADEGAGGGETGPNEADLEGQKNPASGAGFSGNPASHAKNPASHAPNPSGTVISKSTASDEAGAEAPSISALVWKEALDLLRTHSTASETNQRKLIGSWLKRTSSDADKEKLLAIVRTARRAGTADPESYIAKAVNEAFPPPPDPKSYTETKWGFIARAAVERKEWDKRLGPPPGKRGCLMPTHLITSDLINAVSKGAASCRN
jgi:hypothetical protein